MSRVAVAGRAARLLVLACTLLGLAAMHTIGHAAMAHPHAPGHDRAFLSAGAELRVAEMAHVTLTATVPLATPNGCAGDGCGHLVLLPGGVGGGMGGWELCVAILSGFVVAALLAVLLLSAVTGRFPPRRGGGLRRAAPRGPPVSLFGLRLAAVSVMRT